MRGIVAQFNAGTTGTINVRWRDASGAYATPTGLVYRIDDEDSEAAIKAETSATPADPTVIQISAADNAIIEDENMSEHHVLSIRATFANGDVSRAEGIIVVTRMRFPTS